MHPEFFMLQQYRQVFLSCAAVAFFYLFIFSSYCRHEGYIFVSYDLISETLRELNKQIKDRRR